MEAGSQTLAYPVGGREIASHLAVPAAGRGPGVLVLHEAWGLDDAIRGACARLAREGFVALAPDLFDGRVAHDVEAAGRLAAALDPERVGADLDAGVTALLSHGAVDGSRVGALGFCMGGHLALLVGARNRRVGAVVDFYGLFPSPPLDASGLEAPVLAIFAEDDEYIAADARRRFERELRAAGKRASVHVQPGAKHGFMNETRPDRFDAAAAAQGWDRLLTFLRAELA